MESSRKPVYRYCIVPECKNSIRLTPDKVFFRVPMGAEKRKEWCKVIGRDEVSPKTCLHCCEDHFNIKEDTTNYRQYIIMKQEGVKVTLKLKDGVLPHKFHCQKRNTVTVLRKSAIKKKRLALLEEPDDSGRNISEYCDSLETNYDDTGPSTCYENTVLENKNQMDIKCEYGCENNQENMFNNEKNNVALSTLKCSFPLSNSARSLLCPIVKEELSSGNTDSFSMASLSSQSQEYVTRCPSGSSRMSDSDNLKNEKHLENVMHTAVLTAIEKEPKLLLGLPKESYNLIKLLSEKIPLATADILITLKKIKLNDSFSILALHFGYSPRTISRIFYKSVTLIADKLKDLIVWPVPDKIYNNLPISFRSRYVQVVSIIDCFEIQIEKPTNPAHESLTWSQEKKSNTIKYLISCAPDGLITFTSNGYGGRTTDLSIVEDCGYLECLPPNRGVMAYRGFKDLSFLLQSKRCTLIQPPLVSKLSPSTEDVKRTKHIAALRIHIERVISRLREFHMLLPHAHLDHNLIPIIDEVVIIACSLINMQRLLIKK